MTVTAFATPQSPPPTTHLQRPSRCEILNLTERNPQQQLLRNEEAVVTGNNQSSVSARNG
jgi:hypothetical protein